jgi:mannose-1-phosphate guanylyltransferase/mannose-6-phosphate isomerase
MQIIINAGGSGSRLWPLSTSQTPKQFCFLLDDKSLLQATFERLLKSFPPDIIWVSTNQKHQNLVKEQLPLLNPDHILIEPERRDTFPAVIAHAAIVASKTNPNEPIIFISSDQHIAPEISVENQNKALKIVSKSLDNNEFEIVVVGIKPNSASDKYGYIEISSDQKKECYSSLVQVSSFREKPSIEKAVEYIKKGNYFWNFGSFSFTYKNLKAIIKKLYPQTIEALDNIFTNGNIDLESFRKLPKISFDYAILEQTSNLGVIAVELEIWDDLGSFDSLYQYLPEVVNHEDLDKNFHKINQKAIEISGKGNKVKMLDKQKKVAFVGVSNLVLVEDKDGILIINPDKAGDVKKIAEYFEN